MKKTIHKIFTYFLVFFILTVSFFIDFTNTEAQTVYTFDYTGNYQIFTVPKTGLYNVQLWGASGGDYTKIGGYGAYTKGLIELKAGQKIYIYVGQTGDGMSTTTFNGGGASAATAAYSGGGATDIRLYASDWNNFDSLKSRIMVAAGGGGATGWSVGIAGANAGAIEGYNGNYYRASGSSAITVAIGGTQTSGGNGAIGALTGGAGSFGTGGASNISYGGGGGAGYFGGGGGTYNSSVVSNGGSGSSFISGYLGCNAIDQSSTSTSIVSSGSSVHYSGMAFSNAVMIDGAGNKYVSGKLIASNMPSKDGTSTLATGTGNNGNGYARIEFVEDTTEIDSDLEEYTVGDTFTYGYIGNYQKFVAPADGTYNVQLWGAVGGIGRRNSALTYAGGRGAYTAGNVHLDKGTVVYIYVGDSGKNGASVSSYVGGLGGWNGGGKGGDDSNHDSDPDSGGGGGGSTDIRLVSGTWSSFDSLKSRIMVAAGGGGSSYCSTGAGGGTLTGLSGYNNAGYGTQTSGYAFGYAGAGTAATSGGGGGGSGWYGGRGAGECTTGASGSSFISGYSGALSITSASTSTAITHQADSYHYSGLYFTDGSMLAGTSTMPTYTGTSTMTGNASSGYAKITIASLDYSSSKLASLDINPGELQQTFSSDTYEYDAIVSADSYKVNISATALYSQTTIVSGVGEVVLNAGVTRHEVVTISETGNISVYALNITRPASSYKYLDGITIDGVEIPNFSPTTYNYSVDLDFSKDTVSLDAILGRPSQSLIGVGTITTGFGDTVATIDVISEDGLSTTTYTVTFHKGHTSKLKSLTVGVGTLNPIFNSETFTYALEVPSNTLSLAVNAIAYDSAAVVTIKGNGYLKSGANTVTVLVQQSSVESTLYTIVVTREGEVSQTTYEYACTGNYQEFVAPGSGNYKMELWGAQGGIGRRNSALTYAAGKGAYTSGTVWLNKGETFYIYVGCAGKNGASVSSFVGGLGGYNGGGKGGDDSNHDSSPDSGGGGGGSTDIRTVAGVTSNFESLKSRLMIAAGGGGSSYGGIGGAGGTLLGIAGYGISTVPTQTKGNSFGIGATGITQTSGSGGGGGGYYGGYTATYTSGTGGSSFISGYTDANAVDALSVYGNIIHTGQSVHYSGYKFTDTSMLSGNQSMPNTTSGYITGKTGNGYAKITMLPLPSENNYLTSLTTSVGTLSPTFSLDNQEYSVTLTSDLTSIEISARPEDSKATVTGNGKYSIPSGTTPIPITVTAESGATRIYTVNVTRPASNNSNPTAIYLSGLVPSLCAVNSSYCVLSSSFDVNTHTYYLTVPSKIKELLFTVEKGHDYQTVIGEGKVSLVGGENNITIEITSEDGTSTNVYNYVITRDMTGNCNLESLTINNPLIDINFDSSITEYYFSVSNSYTSIDLTAVLEDPSATYKVTGNSNFLVGVNNEVDIEVTAVNGEKKTYTLFVYREQSGNTFLTDITVKNGTTNYSITPVFTKTIFGTYVATVPNDVTSIELGATTEVVTTTVLGTGTKTLTTGNNKFDIVTTAEDGSISTYNVSVYREKSTNNNLSNLVVDLYTLDPIFSSSTTTYSLTVDPGVKSLNITPTLADQTAKYTIIGNSNFVVGNNIVTVRVTAENGTTKDYIINVVRPASTNNNLSNIILSSGTLSPSFSKETTEYDVTVPNSISSITITGVLESTLAKVSGNGKYTLQAGLNEIELQVTSESMEIKSYIVRVHRELNSNCNLVSITNTGNYSMTPTFSSSQLEYVINVQNEINTITLAATAEVSTTTVTGSGKYSLNTGTNDINFVAKAEDGTTKTYVVHVVRDKSTNDDLKYLLVHEGAISPSFSPTIIEYTVKVNSDVTSLTIDAITEDSNATYQIINGSNLVMGNNTVIVRVTAEAGGTYTKDYTINVIRQNAPTSSNLLTALTVSKGTLSPTFSKNTYFYDVVVENSVTSLTVGATKEDSLATITGTGTYTLGVGITIVPVRVTSVDGIEQDYQIRVTRKKSSDSSLSKLVVSGSTLSPSFSSSTTSYTLSTYLDKLDISTIQTTQTDATYVILNNSNFVNGMNVVTIRVTAPDLVTTTDYVLNVTKNLSNNNNLSSLSVDGGTISPVFDKATTLYYVTVTNDVNSIVVNAIAESSLANVDGTGNISLSVGQNILEVTVTSESGNIKKYIIYVTREGESNNLLSDLSTSVGTLSPVFSSNVNTYSVVVPYEDSTIDIFATSSSSLAKVSGVGTHTLNVGLNNINVLVTAENGTINTYTINVTRKEIVSAKLKTLSATNYDISPTFNSNINDYSVVIDNEITSLDLKVETLDPNATYEIIGNSSFNVGINTVTILVTASDNVTTNTYTIDVNRQVYSNTYLDYLYTSVGTMNPVFTKETLSYVVNVDNSVTSIEVGGAAVNASSTVTGLGVYNLIPGDNKIPVVVTSNTGVKRTYIVNVVRAKSIINTLDTLIVKKDGVVQTISPTFVKTTNSYTLTVPAGTESIDISATADSTATIIGTGNHLLNVGSNVIKVTVTSESGEVNIYTVTVTKTASSNNFLTDLQSSSGELSPSFSYYTTDYTVNVDSATSLLSFTYSTEDKNATVSGYDSQIIPDGTSTRKILVTAEDGTVRTYTITVIRERTDNAKLSSLSVSGYTFNEVFSPDVYTYTFSVANTKKVLLPSEVTAVASDSNAVVTKMNTLSLLTGVVNSYTVTVMAPDGFTSKTYTINVTRQKGNTVTLNSLTVNKGYLTTTFNPSVNSYTWKVPGSVTTLTDLDVSAIATDTNAVIEKTEILDLRTEGTKTYSVKVTAEDGSTTNTYILAIEYDLSVDATLSSLVVDNGKITPTFSKNTYDYVVNVYTDLDKINISAIPTASTSTVSGSIGEIALTSEITDLSILVTSEGGTTQVYKVVVKKDIKKDLYLSDIKLLQLDGLNCSTNSCILSPTFVDEHLDYSITVPYEYEKLYADILTTNTQQTYKVYKGTSIISPTGYSLIVGDNIFKIEVYDGLNNLTSTYNLTVNRKQSSNSYLSSLDVTNYALDKTFDKNTLEYSIEIPYSVDSVEVNAFVEDTANASVQIIGSTYLSVGNNDVLAQVTAGDGSMRVYVIHVLRLPLVNNYLKNITVSTGIFYDLTPKFNKATTSYTTTVPSTVSKITLEAVPDYSTTTVTGTGEKQIVTGTNKFTLTTLAEDGTSVTYTVTIIREKSKNVYLKSLSALEGTLSPTFNKDVVKYTMDVDQDVSSLNLTAVLEDSTSTYAIKGNSNFKTGSNVVTITVTAEDKSTIKTYVITVNKEASSNNLLSSLTVSNSNTNYPITPIFNSSTNSYSVTVPYNISNVDINSTSVSIYSSIIGNGNYSLVYGSNLINVVVSAEDGTLNTYVVEVVREYNKDLKSIISDQGDVSPTFDPSVLDYTLSVPNNVTEITFIALKAASNVTVTGNGTYTLKKGANLITFIVTAPDGTLKQYTVTVNREASSNNYLSSLLIHEGKLVQAFDKTRQDYTVYIPNNYTKITADVTLEDSKATYSILNNNNLVMGDNTVTIRVTAEDLTTRDYNIKVVVQEASTFSNRLSSLTVSSGTLSPDFMPALNYYAVTVNNSIEQITIGGIRESVEATATGFGQKALSVGKNIFTIDVTSKDGVLNTYTLVIYRNGSNDAKISSMSFSEGTLSPIFDRNTFSYQITVDSSVNKLTPVITMVDPNATYTIVGNENLQSGDNEIIVRTTSADKSVTLEYIIKVTKSLSTNNYLSSLSVDGHSITPGFTKTNQGPYIVNVDSTIKTIVVDGILEDNTASLSGIGSYSIGIGQSIIKVTATSQKGESRIYTLIVNKGLDSNSKLKTLSIKETSITPVFDPSTLNYTATVTSEIDSITIEALADNTITSVVSGSGVHSLNYGSNTIPIVVTAENGSTTTYNVIVTREPDLTESSKILKLSINEGQITPTFNKDVNEYMVYVPNEITSLTYGVILEDLDATYEVTGNSNFVVGENTVTFTSTNGGSSTDYVVKVIRQTSASTYLSSLTVSKGELSPTFNKNTLKYTVLVPSTVTSLNIQAVSESVTSTVSGTGDITLEYGENIAYVTVTSSGGITRTYTVVINRKLSSNNLLTSLSSDIGVFDVAFDPLVNTYTLTVPTGNKKVTLQATSEVDSTVTGEGIIDTVVGTVTREIIVTSLSGEKNVYTVNIVRPASNNVDIVSIVPTDGVLNPVFDNTVNNYTITVDDNTSIIDFTVITSDINASVDKPSNITLSYGNNTVLITVIAEDLITTRTVTINVIRTKKLVSIDITDKELIMAPGTTVNANVMFNPIDATNQELTWESTDTNIVTVNNGSITAVSKGNAEIKVVSKENPNVSATIIVNVLSLNFETNVYTVVREVDPANSYIIGSEPSVIIKNFLANFDNNIDTLSLYELNGTTIDDYATIIATGMTIKLEINSVIYDEAKVVVRGDINGDGIINVSDTTSLKKHILNKEQLAGYYFAAGNTNFSDSIVNVSDSSKLKNYILKKISILN